MRTVILELKDVRRVDLEPSYPTGLWLGVGPAPAPHASFHGFCFEVVQADAGNVVDRNFLAKL